MLSREQVLHIAKLSKFKISEEEIERFRKQLSEVIDYFEVLKKVNTDHIEPRTHAFDDLSNRFQENELSTNTIKREVALSNAKSKGEKYFITDAVL